MWAHRGSLRGFFDIQSPYQRLPCCCGAALWECSVLVEEQVSATPIPELCFLLLQQGRAWAVSHRMELPQLSPQQDSPREPLGTSWKCWERAAVHGQGVPVLAVFPAWSHLVVSRFCRCSRSLRSRFHRWSLPSSGTGNFPALPCVWMCC